MTTITDKLRKVAACSIGGAMVYLLLTIIAFLPIFTTARPDMVYYIPVCILHVASFIFTLISLERWSKLDRQYKEEIAKLSWSNPESNTSS